MPTDRTIISRADHPARSIREPITIEEWLNYVASHSHLAMDEHRRGTNPFTNETVLLLRWPGRAKLTGGVQSAHITYSQGRLVLSCDAGVTTDHTPTMQTIADDLHARLF